MRTTGIGLRPAPAATDIGLLIGDSVDKVPKASKLVGQQVRPAPARTVFKLDRAALAGFSRPRFFTTVHS